MNILIVSYEAWRDTNNGGNVLSNIFCSFSDCNIAQVYCCGELPQNSICQKYFQISDGMLLSTEKGHRLDEKNYSKNTNNSENVENKIKNKIPSLFKEASLFARELLWMVFDWKTEELESFIREFDPDIIFAPCYSYYHVSKLALYVRKIANCPMISYISDDNYSLKQFRFSPSFWINRLITRKWIRKIFAESSLIYTMTEMQKKEYEALFGRPMKVLCKSARFEERKKETSKPVQIIYAGGLYLNRWKILSELSDALSVVNKTRVKAELHIFSGSKLSKRKVKKLNDGRNSFLHSQLPYEELMARYRNSDVAVHVESFDIKNRLITRLSFSTKIIDCLSSGCAILVIGPKNQAGVAYLKDNDAAICINDIKQLCPIVDKLVSDDKMIKEYSEKAYRLGINNHQKSDIEKSIRQDFYEIAEMNLQHQ